MGVEASVVMDPQNVPPPPAEPSGNADSEATSVSMSESGAGSSPSTVYDQALHIHQLLREWLMISPSDQRAWQRRFETELTFARNQTLQSVEESNLLKHWSQLQEAFDAEMVRLLGLPAKTAESLAPGHQVSVRTGVTREENLFVQAHSPPELMISKEVGDRPDWRATTVWMKNLPH